MAPEEACLKQLPSMRGIVGQRLLLVALKELDQGVEGCLQCIARQTIPEMAGQTGL